MTSSSVADVSQGPGRLRTVGVRLAAAAGLAFGGSAIVFVETAAAGSTHTLTSLSGHRPRPIGVAHAVGTCAPAPNPALCGAPVLMAETITGRQWLANRAADLRSLALTGSDQSRSNPADAVDSYRQATATALIVPPKVSICHKGDNGLYTLIQIAAAALPQHIAHGDGSVGGAVPGAVGMVFAADCTVVSRYARMIVADSPMHYWRFEETQTSQVARDEGLAGGNNGIYTGGITLNQPGVSNAVGSAARFDGAAGTFVDVGLFHPGDALTVEAWVSLDSGVSKAFHSAVSRWGGSYELDINQTTGDLGNFVSEDTASTFKLAATTTPVSRSQWHHLVGVFAGGMMRVYLDGVSGPPVPVGVALHNAGPVPDRVLIGATRDGAGIFSYNWTGLIDEVAIYDHALTPAQIQAHMQAAMA